MIYKGVSTTRYMVGWHSYFRRAHFPFPSSVFRKARNGAPRTLRRQEGGAKLEWALTSDEGGRRHFRLQTLLSSTPFLGVSGFMNLAVVRGCSDQLHAKLSSPSPLCSRFKERSGSEKWFSLTLLVGEDVAQCCYLKKSPRYICTWGWI